MALTKNVDTDYGVQAVYWNIGSIQEDFKGRGAEVTFFGYASQEAREANKQPISAGKMQVAGTEYTADLTRSVAYGLMKQRPEFENAEDC